MINKKYRLLGGNLGGRGPKLLFAGQEVAMDKIPDPRLVQHVQLPPNASKDIITFGAKYVESGPNLNRAYFANSELVLAYHTVPYKALDLEHETEKIVGHIHSAMYIDRSTGNALDPEGLSTMDPAVLDKLPIDVIIGGVVYVDRFPMLESPVSTKAYKISMETYFDSFDILLENGTKLSLEEAEAMGLGEFIDQLMGSFESQEDFDRAHSLWVTTADNNRSQMKIYKYLHGLLFSGGGLVLNPACPSCHILSTSCDCEDLKMAASIIVVNTESKIKEFEIDLRKSDSYMKTIREQGGVVMVHQVTEEIKTEDKAQVIETPVPVTAVKVEETAKIVEDVAESTTHEVAVETVTVEEPAVETAEFVDDTIHTPPPTDLTNPPTPTPHTRVDLDSKPSHCPQYRYREETSCLYANSTCEVAGDRKDKGCRRWFQDEKGVWKFDSRNNVGDAEEVVVNENMENPPEIMADDTAKRKHLDWLSKKIESLTYALESFHLEREVAQSKLSEKAGTWTSQFINGLPSSSFAVVETGYKDGDNKNARHLPFKDGGGKVDLPHLRNALARANQIKNVLGNDSDADLRARAQRKLAPFAKRYLKTDKEG
jgi:hypothetical protein